MDLKQRLLSKIKKTDNGCWEWQGVTNKGYGRLNVDGQMVYSHRLSFLLFKGEIAEKMVVCHSCDNPRCINPAHLFLGEQRDNVRDACSKGRHQKGERNGLSKLTNDDVRLILGSDLGCRELAKQLGVHHSQVSRIRNGKAWRHVT